MRSITSAVLLALLISIATPSFSTENNKPDFRQVNWGMSRDEVMKHENAEKVKETDSILVYFIKGGPKHHVFHTHPDFDGKSMEMSIDIDVPDYNLVYLFQDGKLGMAIMHMDNPKAKPGDYLDELDFKDDEITEATGKEPKGMAKYGKNKTEDAIYDHPERICSGIYAVKLIWPDVNDRTNIPMELDDRKSAEDKSECTLSIFYESVKHPLDPASSAKMHEVL